MSRQHLCSQGYEPLHLKDTTLKVDEPPWGSADGPGTRYTQLAGPCTPGTICSPTSSKDRLEALFAADDHAEVEATWGIYQRVIAAYRQPDGT